MQFAIRSAYCLLPIAYLPTAYPFSIRAMSRAK